MFSPIRWQEEKLFLLDQRILPQQEEWLELSTAAETAKAITDMVVRGAPAIGVTAAFGVVLALKNDNNFDEDIKILLDARPTAINLAWAVKRMQKKIESAVGENALTVAIAEAEAIHAEDIAANQKLGDLGADLIGENSGVLTHCNAGALATGGYGTALGVIRSAWRDKKVTSVYADETRPWLQGARLTAWELLQDDIPVSLLVDGAAAWLMQQGRVQWVVVGSDRIAANGDVANKIGTYGVAIAARHHGVKFMVAAPTSTIDRDCPSGKDIPIEQRDPDELFVAGGSRVAAESAGAWNPVFDVTPAELVDAIVTERGLVLNPTTEKIAKLFGSD